MTALGGRATTVSPPLDRSRAKRLLRGGVTLAAVWGVVLTTVLFAALVVDVAAIDRTTGGYEAPYTGWTGSAIDFSEQAVTDTGFVKVGYVLDILTDCTTGVGTGELLGVRLPIQNQFSDRALSVHNPHQACRDAAFDPKF